MLARGRLITIEGLDGAGKTTLAAGLERALREQGIDVEVLREPGGVELAERIRELVKDPRLTVAPRAEALLYAAARAQLVDEALMPRLEQGRWVILDRFVDSSLAYQGGGRELGTGAILDVNAFAAGELTPDRTLLVVIDPAVGRRRTQARGEAIDRLEAEHEAFFTRVARTYDELAAADPRRIRRLDGEQAPERVLEAALAELRDLL